jgi:hypothetical protein
MKPTKAQLYLAAKLYGLAILASRDTGDTLAEMGDELQAKLTTLMTQQAERSLRKRWGLTWQDVQSEDLALAAAIRLKP